MTHMLDYCEEMGLPEEEIENARQEMSNNILKELRKRGVEESKAQAKMSEGRKHKSASKGGGRFNLPGLREIRPSGLD